MAKPWRIIDRIDVDEGLLDLRQRGRSDFLITLDGRVLMNASANRSEIVLAELACDCLPPQKNPRVLVGGLGMGFTLQAALNHLPAAAELVVAELNPIMIDWCRGPLAHLNGAAVDDPRVTIVIDDVAAVIRRAASRGGGNRFEAVILDLYEGPCRAGRESCWYGDEALTLSRRALTTDGVLAVWSEDPDAAFEKRLQGAGFSVCLQRPGRGGRRHAVYIARKTGGALAGGHGKAGPAARRTRPTR